MLWNSPNVLAGPWQARTPLTSPGPWRALADQAIPNGAVLIEDAAGEIVAWATDKAGHTSEWSVPDGRTPAEIAANARLLANAWLMAAACGLLCRGMHLLEARLAKAGVPIHVEVTQATAIARHVVAELEQAGIAPAAWRPEFATPAPAGNDTPTPGAA